MSETTPGLGARQNADGAALAGSACARCGKPAALCVCRDIEPIDNRVSVLILQHPREQDRLLGTARLAAFHFRHALLKVGLSWPSLAKILGRPADSRRWAVALSRLREAHEKRA